MSIKRLSTVLLLATFTLAGCGDDEADEIVVGGSTAPPAGGAGAPPPAAAANGPAPVPSDLPPLPTKEFKERDFSETASNRDPFRNYDHMFDEESNVSRENQRTVMAPEHSLEELKLVGLISRGGGRVLLTDPNGLGWVAKLGDYVGRSEMVSAGGVSRTEVPMNWRVDRIRDNDVVFIREDPAHPEIPATTRVLTLRTADELKLDLSPVIGGEPPPKEQDS